MPGRALGSWGPAKRATPETSEQHSGSYLLPVFGRSSAGRRLEGHGRQQTLAPGRIMLIGGLLCDMPGRTPVSWGPARHVTREAFEQPLGPKCCSEACRVTCWAVPQDLGARPGMSHRRPLNNIRAQSVAENRAPAAVPSANRSDKSNLSSSSTCVIKACVAFTYPNAHATSLPLNHGSPLVQTH